MKTVLHLRSHTVDKMREEADLRLAKDLLGSNLPEEVTGVKIIEVPDYALGKNDYMLSNGNGGLVGIGNFDEDLPVEETLPVEEDQGVEEEENTPPTKDQVYEFDPKRHKRKGGDNVPENAPFWCIDTGQKYEKPESHKGKNIPMFRCESCGRYVELKKTYKESDVFKVTYHEREDEKYRVKGHKDTQYLKYKNAYKKYKKQGLIPEKGACKRMR